MSSTHKSCTSTLSLTDIMENGFLIGSSSCSISPRSSCSLEMNSLFKSDAWDSGSNLITGSLPASKATESSLSSLKGDLQTSCDSVASFCETPPQPCAFDLSNESSANGQANSITNAFCGTKSSTPCREKKLSKLAENELKSSEMNDLAGFKKPLPLPPVWEISGIQATRDNTISLGSSLEELGSLGSMKPDTPSLEVLHFEMPLAGGSASAIKHQATAL
ncbi:hypothetical protein lerEdw1_016923 [Lerista edwardsae]|nr:hypothetical protein lerEdw1_016923 [Lerista edwardsae]